MSNERVCPWYLGYFLASPVRKILQHPVKILSPHVKEGMTTLDIGSAMGYFTLPLAELVGKSGRVIAVDLQEKMISVLAKKAKRRGLAERIETRICTGDSFKIDDLAGKIDVALTFAVLHEIPDQPRALAEIVKALKGGGTMVIAEPKGHVTKEEFQQTLSVLKGLGMEVAEWPEIWHSEAVVMKKQPLSQAD